MVTLRPYSIGRERLSDDFGKNQSGWNYQGKGLLKEHPQKNELLVLPLLSTQPFVPGRVGPSVFGLPIEDAERLAKEIFSIWTQGDSRARASGPDLLNRSAS